MAVLTAAQRTEAWGKPCAKRPTQPVYVPQLKRNFDVWQQTVEWWETFFEATVAYEYEPSGGDTGFYSCRHMRHDPNMPMSVHSWVGLALDLNWLQNPAGSKLVSDFPPGMAKTIVGIKTNSGHQIVRWGADWDSDGNVYDHSYIDAMHFEIICTPSQLATGVDRSTIIYYNLDQLEDETMKLGDSGRLLKRYQVALNRTASVRPEAFGTETNPWIPLTADGKFGDKTEKAVKLLQQYNGLDQTGVIGSHTAVALGVNLAEYPLFDNRYARIEHGTHGEDGLPVDTVTWSALREALSD